jgi:hypothetical protein
LGNSDLLALRGLVQVSLQGSLKEYRCVFLLERLMALVVSMAWALKMSEYEEVVSAVPLLEVK